jgi:hypothetical protein
MPRLISGSTLRRGGSGEFIDLKGAQPQLPPTVTTETGFTIATDSLLRTTYRSSLGYIEFNSATIYSALPEGTIRIQSSGTAFLSTSTLSGTLVVGGGIGVGGNMTIRDDIKVNSLLIGQGFANFDEGSYNNLIFRGTATATVNDFSNGQNNIAIGYDVLQNIESSYKSIAIGRLALSSGTEVRNSIAIGDSALKENGVTYSFFNLSIDGATIRSSKTITNITNSLPAIITIDSDHNLTTGTRISIANVSGITTGSISLVNGQSFYVVPLSSNTFEIYNNSSLTTSTAVDSTFATIYLSSGTLIYPLELTIPNNDYSTGTAIRLTNLINGLNELDFYTFYTYPLGSNVFQLYNDNILSEGVDGTDLTPYSFGGTSTRILLSANNIAIGTNAGKSLYDGERNFFLGDFIAQNLTTGSYNFFIGHEVGNNLTRGSGNVSIMGDNLIDGLDNQVNIGGIFYYNGAGFLTLNSDVGLGLGSIAVGNTGGALIVFGGINVSENIITNGPVEIKSTNQTTATTNGALIVAGGAGISGDVYIGGQLKVEGPEQVTLNPSGANVVIQPQTGGNLSIFPQIPGVGNIDNTIIGLSLPKEGYFTNIQSATGSINSSTNATGTTTGALVIVGGVGIGKDLYVGGTIYGTISGVGISTTATNLAGGSTGSVVYQLAPGNTGFIPIGGSGQVLLSDGSNPYWGDVSAAGTSTNAEKIYIDVAATSTQYYLALADTISNYTTVTSDLVLAYQNGNLIVPSISITSTISSTSTNSNQALLVAGGIGVAGSIRSLDGQLDEDYLLYTPRVTISTSTPLNPRVGDFWIDPNYGVEFQWIKDGTSTFWIQFTGF